MYGHWWYACAIGRYIEGLSEGILKDCVTLVGHTEVVNREGESPGKNLSNIGRKIHHFGIPTARKLNWEFNKIKENMVDNLSFYFLKILK